MTPSPLVRRGSVALFGFAIAIAGAAMAGCTSDSDNPGAPDAGVNDAAPRDTSAGGTALPDTSVGPDAADAETADTSVADSEVTDTSVSDTLVSDTLVSDTAIPDTALPETATLSDAAFATTANLLLNGDAEAAPGSPSAQVVTVPDWTGAGGATVVTYGAAGGYPASTDPGPSDRGLNFFCGGASDALSTFTQHVDLAAYAPAISLGNVTYTLSAYLGGFSSQSDNAVLTVTFLDAANASVGTGSIGPVTPADRANATALLFTTADGAVPKAAISADVVLTLTRTEGSANDGYADDLSITLTGH